MAAASAPGGAATAALPAQADPRRWLVLAVAGIAQFMIVVDITIMNIALPSAQRALHFSNADRQWVITAYALAVGSLMLFGGRLGDLFGRKVTFLTGLIGFAAASAAGGASTSFTMLITARACQGAFAALLAPAALSVLTTTFTEPRERGKAFGVYGAIAGGGGLVGPLLGGLLTEYLDWRWCLYVNLVFAVVAAAGAALLLRHQRRTGPVRLDVPGVLIVSASMFCLVYGFANAATHNWHPPSTGGFLAAGAVLLAAFVAWQARSPSPLLPLQVIADRNRGAANLAILIVGASMFGLFLFLTYYLQTIRGYSPVITGLAFLPATGMVMIMAMVSNIVLMPRVGPKPLVGLGMLIAAAGMVWLTRIGVHSGYPGTVLGPLMVAGAGIGMSLPPSMNAGTFGGQHHGHLGAGAPFGDRAAPGAGCHPRPGPHAVPSRGDPAVPGRRSRRGQHRSGRHRRVRPQPSRGRRHPARGLAGGLAAAVIIGALAGLLPAIRAARLSPTQALLSV